MRFQPMRVRVALPGGSYRPVGKLVPDEVKDVAGIEPSPWYSEPRMMVHKITQLEREISEACRREGWYENGEEERLTANRTKLYSLS
jgi:hypothetical protein